MKTQEIFSIYLEIKGTESIGLTSVFQSQTSDKAKNLSKEEIQEISELVRAFSKDRLGMHLSDKSNPSQNALDLTFYPVRDNDTIRWDEPLFDSDGYPNTLIALSAFDVVTKCSIAYMVWNRKTGQCKNKDCEDLTIGNTPMSNQDIAIREAHLLEILRSGDGISNEDGEVLASRLEGQSRPRSGD